MDIDREMDREIDDRGMDREMDREIDDREMDREIDGGRGATKESASKACRVVGQIGGGTQGAAPSRHTSSDRTRDRKGRRWNQMFWWRKADRARYPPLF